MAVVVVDVPPLSVPGHWVMVEQDVTEVVTIVVDVDVLDGNTVVEISTVLAHLVIVVDDEQVVVADVGDGVGLSVGSLGSEGPLGSSPGPTPGGGLYGLGLGGGPSVTGTGPEGFGHSPEMWIPNILTHGRWKEGSSGNLIHVNVTQGTGSRSQMISGSHVGHGRMMGTIVVA